MTMKRLRFERIALGWSQRELAANAQIAAQTVSAIERGVHLGWPGELARLAKALQFTGEPSTLTEDVDVEYRVAQEA